jgi:cytochrome c biogenesis protein CcdA/glutaredoxin
MDKTTKTAGIALAAILIIVTAFLVVPGLSASLMPAASVPATPQGAGTLTVYFIYGEECPHCHEVKPFVESLREKYPDVDFQILEIWHNPSNYELSTTLHRNLGVESSGVPEVIVGDVVLVGSRDIPQKLEQTILDQKKNIIREIPSTSVLGSGPDIVQTSPSVSAVYFYGDTCSHCEKLKPLLAEMEEKYPELSLTRLEVYNNAKNRQQLAVNSLAYGIENAGVPIIFIGGQVLSGDLEINNRFEAAILLEKQRLASGNETAPTPAVTPDPGNIPTSSALTLPLVVGAALVDSVNPCGLSVLVFLLITMTAAAGRKRILLAGAAFIAATFLFHLLVGIGLFSVFSLSGLSKLFSIIGGAVALLLGIITIIDVLRNNETFFLSISVSHKGLLGDYARRASLPAAFVLGILAGLLGFSCTGGIYISILGLMGRDMAILSGLSWLVLYNLVYILPLVVVTLFVAYGVSPERADQMRAGSRRTLRAIVGLILIVLGAVILLGWIG